MCPWQSLSKGLPSPMGTANFRVYRFRRKGTGLRVCLLEWHDWRVDRSFLLWFAWRIASSRRRVLSIAWRKPARFGVLWRSGCRIWHASCRCSSCYVRLRRRWSCLLRGWGRGIRLPRRGSRHRSASALWFLGIPLEFQGRLWVSLAFCSFFSFFSFCSHYFLSGRAFVLDMIKAAISKFLLDSVGSGWTVSSQKRKNYENEN